MIDFELPPQLENTEKMTRGLAEKAIRPISRYYDEHEHESPQQFIDMMWPIMREQAARGARARAESQPSGPSMANVSMAVSARSMSWGDAAMAICLPGSGLGGAAIQAVATAEQKERFLKRYTEGEPKWGAMAITEAGAGSDSAAITTTAVRDGDEWVLNGEKIFVTCGKRAAEESDGVVVVWATVDRSAGRAGIKPFVVEKGTPGMKVMGLERKMGIRASDTATIVFEDCRIPLDNILGSPEVMDRSKGEGFKGVMATFDATRPYVAAMALGVGWAALDFVKEALEDEGVPLRYGLPRNRLTSVERDVMEMEAGLKAAWLLCLRAAWMMDQRRPNNLEASMAKAKAGIVVTRVTQKAVELMGPLGYSRKHLLEKWMRDAKINDIFEGTGQINTLIVARRILGYSSKELR